MYILSVFQQFVRDPRTVGAVAPSSRKLGQALARYVDPLGSSTVLELGSGCGAVTQVLVDRIEQTSRLYCIEKNHNLNLKFVQKFYGSVRNLEIDCVELTAYFRDMTISNIVCCLPFKSIPSKIAKEIVDNMFEISKNDTIISHFTYDLFRRKSILDNDIRFRKVKDEYVFTNIPPAKVVHYCVREKHQATRID